MRRLSCASLGAAALLAFFSGCGDEPSSISPASPGAAAVAGASSLSAATFQTSITFGPFDGGTWGPDVTFEWSSPGADRFRWTLLTKEEFETDTGLPFTTLGVIAWADTLAFHPDLAGGYDKTRPAWIESRDFRARIADLPRFTGGGQQHLYCFAVRAVDRVEVEDLAVPRNFRVFTVSPLGGPRIFLVSDLGGVWNQGDPVLPREVFVGDGMRFEWSALPGVSQTPVKAFSFALDDTTKWAPLSGDLTSWPRGDDVWRAAPGPHTFWVKAVDEGGFTSVLEAQLDVHAGPRACAPADRDVLVVLDTNPITMVTTYGIWPMQYEVIERALADIWFAGYDYRVFETHGTTAPSAADLDCASSVFWFHGASAGDGDNSVLTMLHRGGSTVEPDRATFLSSYVAAGGNLFLCGVQPVQAMRYFGRIQGAPQFQQIPVWFERTLTDPFYFPHWAATRLGIGRINASVGNTFPSGQSPLRLSVATSSLPGEYPDLAFDPLRWPDGPVQGGFGFYDRDVVPLAGSGAEVAYTVNATGLPVAVRRLTDPGVNGNTFFLGLHPYFVIEPSFVQLMRAR
jgi:hypothetical protein